MAVLNDFAPQFLLDKRPSKPNRYAIRYVRGLIPVTIVWPTVTAITYGQTVGESVLVGGSATTPWGSNAPGTFSWADPDASLDAGSYNLSVIFTPNRPKTFETVADDRPLVINKITPTVSAWPTASGITYLQALSSSTLSGGTASVPGTFEWVSAGTTPNAGTANQSARFVPTDATNYSTVTGNVSVVTAKATPTVTTWPTASQINYGQLLSTSTLTGGVASTAGTFSWTTGSTVPNHSVNYNARFVPTDTANYNVVNGSVHLLVVKTHAPGFVSAVNGGTLTLNLTGSYVISATARWQGQLAYGAEAYVRNTAYSGALHGYRDSDDVSPAFVMPTLPAGTQFVKQTVVVRAKLNNYAPYNPYNVRAIASTQGASDEAIGYDTNSVTARATRYSYGTGWAYGYSYCKYAGTASARSYTYYKPIYNTVNPSISYTGGSRTHWGTVANGSNTTTYTLTGLQNNAVNTITHSIGESLVAKIDLQVTYYTTG
jgi:hypothetical protein